MKLNLKYRPELVCSNDQTRYNLCEPYYDAPAKRVVATNGHSMVTVPVEVSEGEDASRYVGRSLLKLAREWAKTKGVEQVEIKGDGVVDGPSYPCRQDGTFPKWQEVLPAKRQGAPGTVTVAFDAVLLLDLAHALGADPKRHRAQVALTIDIADVHAPPLLVSLYGEEGAVGVLMPCVMMNGKSIEFHPTAPPPVASTVQVPPSTITPPPAKRVRRPARKVSGRKSRR